MDSSPVPCPTCDHKHSSGLRTTSGDRHRAHQAYLDECVVLDEGVAQLALLGAQLLPLGVHLGAHFGLVLALGGQLAGARLEVAPRRHQLRGRAGARLIPDRPLPAEVLLLRLLSTQLTVGNRTGNLPW